MNNNRVVFLLGIIFSLSTVIFSQSAPQDPNSQNSPANQPSGQPSTQSPNTQQSKASDPVPDAPSTAKDRAKTEEEREIERKEQSQKMLGVIPQFSVTSRRNAPPLTPSEKFKLMARGTINPFEFFATGLQAGLSQATNEFPEYGQGTSGYAKRYGAAFTDQATSQFFSNYFYPVLLKEDPRYFRLGEGTIKHRILYSLAQEFVVVKDDGTRGFNYSNVLGAFTSGSISNLYYPQGERGWSNTLSRSAIALSYGSAGGLADEFWTDVRDKWVAHRKKKGEQQAQE